jgi:hypothetical protein
MSIQFGDILKHNNLVYPIVDINDVKGGLRSIATFSSPALVSEYASIPEKYRSGYSLLLETSTGTIYYLAGLDATNKFHWSPVGIGGNGTGVANTIPKWTSSSILGNSNITDNGDTVTINGNLMVIGTTSTISSENLLVKDPIILLAGSQSGTPTYDAGLFVNRGSSDTQAFIWDESMDEFKFITTTSGATVSGDVSIGTYSNVRTGVLSVGTGTRVDSRFIVSSSGGTVSLVVDEFGSVYNRGRGNIFTNTAFGSSALFTNTSGYSNTAIGVSSLLLNTTGHANTALGNYSLSNNTTGNRNTAVGNSSLYNNTTGIDNTGVGYISLYNNTTGSNNTTLGNYSLFQNAAGNRNTAVGGYSLYNNTSGVFLAFSITSGTGYVDGVYSNVTLVYATGSTFLTAPIVDIEIVSGEVSSVTQISSGTGFKDTTTIFTINSYGTYSVGSGFEIGVIALLGGNSNTAIGFQSLYSNTIGSNNVAVGEYSLFNNETGESNIAIGRYSLYNNTSGYSNTTIGDASLYNNTTGYRNTGIGPQSLSSNTTGYENTAIGYQSLSSNTTGYQNIAIGYGSLYSNTSGNINIAIAYGSLYSNTNGDGNIALGQQSLFNNNGNGNIALAFQSLFFNTTGNINIAIGEQSLFFNTTGYRNTAIGYQSLYNNTTGWGNIALGQKSLEYNTIQDRNTALGEWTMRYNRGLWSTAVGGYALQNASQAIDTLSATFSPGSGYTPGTYSNVRLFYNSGTFWGAPTGQEWEFPTAEIVVGAGGTVSSVTLKQRGVVIPDTTTRFRVLTGTQSFQLGTASGTGFSIGIGTIGTASFNNALGHGALANIGVGSDNIAIGMWAGWYYGPTGSSGPLSKADQSIFIGRFTSALDNNTINEIVIGDYAIGNGSNTVTLGNDLVTKTYLKGAVYIGGTTINSNDRLVVSSGGIASLIVDSNGSVYNRGKGSISSNTVFGASALSVNTTGYNNTAIGVNTLLSNTVGHGNTALGALALESSTNNANQNTAVGSQALYSNISGSTNTAVGFESLRQNISGGSNTANGYQTLSSNTTGSGNAAFGYHALYSNNADYNTAVGFESLKLNTSNANAAIGYRALSANTLGNSNTALGSQALLLNSTGSGNVAIGLYALRINNEDENVAIGPQCLFFSTTGIFNVGIGSLTLFSNTTGSGNTVIGHNSLALNTIGDFNIAIGYQAGPGIIGATNSSNSIYIGKSAGQNSNGFVNEIVIGSTMSYGNNTVLLGNDSTTKTYLKGSVQLPTMTTAEINLVSGPTNGQVIYNTTLNQICFYNGSSWRKVTDSAM